MILPAGAYTKRSPEVSTLIEEDRLPGNRKPETGNREPRAMNAMPVLAGL